MKPYLRACIVALTFIASAIALMGQSINVSLPPTVSAGTAYTAYLTAVTAAGQTNTSYSQKVTVTSNDTSAALQSSVAFASGKATVSVAFFSTGNKTLTVTDGAGLTGTATVNVITNSAAALAGCASCFASVGAGVVGNMGNWGDYTNSSNVLQSTHLGSSTPQYAIGVAYKLPIRGLGYGKLGCSPQDMTTKTSDARVAFCYPLKAFVSFKFTPTASQTFGGFTYGASHALHQYLDILIGVSYSPNNEISPGFQQAAINTVKTQQALNNPYYAQYNLTSLQANTPTAFDGFPTQLISSAGVPGGLIYNGSPTVQHYHLGYFVGVAIPLSFKSAVAGQ